MGVCIQHHPRATYLRERASAYCTGAWVGIIVSGYINLYSPTDS